MTVASTSNAAAVALSSAARALCAAGVDTGSDRTRIHAMASTPVTEWSTDMVAAAWRTMRQHIDVLRRIGFDPALLPTGQPAPETTPVTEARAELSSSRAAGSSSDPARQARWARDAASVFDTAAAGAATSTEPVADAMEPFDYEHTIVGLRGIPVSELSTVSERAADGFTQAGIHSVYDLLMHVPLRYIDRTQRTPIEGLQPGEEGTTIAHVRHVNTDRTRSGMRLARIVLVDDTGTLTCTFFNAAWQAKRFQEGDEVVAQGRVTTWTSNQGVTTLQMSNPLLDRTGDEHTPVVPVYPQSGTGKDSPKARLTTWQIHRAAMEAIERMGDLADSVPAELLRAHTLVDRTESFREVHRPTTPGREAAGRDRLAYDELLRMQLTLGMRRAAVAADGAVVHTPTGHITGPLTDSFPHPLTRAQRRAFATIQTDMSANHPMHRLLQGDVGSGKSIVAALTLMVAVEGGHQGALMAPTEILATQLHAELVDLTQNLRTPDGTPLVVATLTNKVRSKGRRDTLEGLQDGSVHLVVGTHALLSDDVQFQSLGAVVVDEQHRFGVEQRAQLRAKGPGGATPDTLVMTATPIPRTAAMTVFGDLETTLLDELPPGRVPVHTAWLDEELDLTEPANPIWVSMRGQLEQGRKGYVVCPLVEDSETKAAAAATDVAAQLTAGALNGYRVGLVHGKQKPAERTEAMDRFRDGDLDVLVATTVIEVGVSVPDATMIVILDPKSFGIAQLHQLRGRVGRSNLPSRCVLAGPAPGESSTRRMEALCATTDGFALSEIDLDIRGPGQILGSSQHGLSDLRVASLTTDARLMEAAREDAATILDGDPVLGRRPALLAEIDVALGADGRAWLGRN